MTKEAYFDMCEALGNEPIDSEIPVEMSDFPDLVQTAFSIYFSLKDIWDPMAGRYLGKDNSILFEFLRLHEVEDSEKLLIVSFMQYMDSIRSKIYSRQQKAQEASKR